MGLLQRQSPTMLFSLLFPLAGCLLTMWLVVQVVSYLARYCRSPIMAQTLGSWALVTGATDGIGKGFCLELAKQGMNIVLVSRNLEKLRVVAKEIEERFDVKTKVVDIDFSKDKDAQSRLETETGTLDVGILVNNVGVSYQYPEYFLQIEDGPAQCRSIVDCNIISTMDVTRAVLPGMVATGKGAIINMSSFLAPWAPSVSLCSQQGFCDAVVQGPPAGVQASRNHRHVRCSLLCSQQHVQDQEDQLDHPLSHHLQQVSPQPAGVGGGDCWLLVP